MGGVKNVEPPPLFGSKIMNLLVLFDFEPKCVSRSRLHGVCRGRSGTSASASYALLSQFWYVGGFGHPGHPVVPTLSSMSGDVVTVYAY